MQPFDYFRRKKEEKRIAKEKAAEEERERLAEEERQRAAEEEARRRAEEERAAAEEERRKAEEKRAALEENRRKKLLRSRVKTVKAYLAENYETHASNETRYSVADEPRFSVSSDFYPSGSASNAPDYLDSFDIFGDLTIDRLRNMRAETGTSTAGSADAGSSKILKSTFPELLRKLMDGKGITPSDVYKRALIDKSTFSKMGSISGYSVSRDTAIQLTIALELSLEEAGELLESAGYALSHSNERDVIIECCIREKYGSVVDVNLILDEFGCKPLGKVIY